MIIKSYFVESNSHNKSKIKAVCDLSNYATKSDLKRATVFDTSEFAKIIHLTSLK